MPSNVIEPASTRARARQDAENGADQRGFAAAGFADDAQDAAAQQAERNMIQHAGKTLVTADDHAEPGHFEDGLRHRDRRNRGSRMSRNPSPSRLKPSTVTKIARPGNIAYHQAFGR